MKAYILHGKNDASFEDIPLPTIGEYDALVKVTTVSTCTTDVHQLLTAAIPGLIGKALGHEAVGIVDKVGSRVKDFKAGDRVVIPAMWSNFRDPAAQRGEAKFHQPNSPYFNKNGGNGLFAEYNRVYDADMTLAKIPDNVTDIQAVMVPDMMNTAFSGISKLNYLPGDTLVVLGIGPVGLMAVAELAISGAGRLIAVGHRANTKKLAREYGATDIVDYKEGDVYDQIMKLTNGKNVDGVIVASGGHMSDQIDLGLKLVKFGGTVANVSVWLADKELTIPAALIGNGYQDKTLATALAGDGRELMQRRLKLIQYGRIDPIKMAMPVLHGWDHLETAINLMKNRDQNTVKPVVVIQDQK